MHSHDEIAQSIESQEVVIDGDAISEFSKIKEILNRAYEIHRSHGGLFGYELEDWLQAQRELTSMNHDDQSRVTETVHADSAQRNQEGNCEQWFGLNN
jgi:hypothetical protein